MKLIPLSGKLSWKLDKWTKKQELLRSAAAFPTSPFAFFKSLKTFKEENLQPQWVGTKSRPYFSRGKRKTLQVSPPPRKRLRWTVRNHNIPDKISNQNWIPWVHKMKDTNWISSVSQQQKQRAQQPTTRLFLRKAWSNFCFVVSIFIENLPNLDFSLGSEKNLCQWSLQKRKWSKFGKLQNLIISMHTMDNFCDTFVQLPVDVCWTQHQEALSGIEPGRSN